MCIHTRKSLGCHTSFKELAKHKEVLECKPDTASDIHFCSCTLWEAAKWWLQCLHHHHPCGSPTWSSDFWFWNGSVWLMGKDCCLFRFHRHWDSSNSKLKQPSQGLFALPFRRPTKAFVFPFVFPPGREQDLLHYEMLSEKCSGLCLLCHFSNLTHCSKCSMG